MNACPHNYKPCSTSTFSPLFLFRLFRTAAQILGEIRLKAFDKPARGNALGIKPPTSWAG